jgi:agmatinase
MLAAAVLAAAIALALAQQVPLGTGPTDYAALFAPGGGQTAHAPGWSKESWNGLVTFGRAPPLRCWGVGGDALFDVAVVGARRSSLSHVRPGAYLPAVQARRSTLRRATALGAHRPS